MNHNKKSPRADKNFGQHFLINTGVVKKIVSAVQSLNKENLPVVEIGPGPGALTKELLKAGLQVIAIELDSRMIEHLEEEFSAQIESGDLVLQQVDATKESAFDLIKEKKLQGLCVCGNLPYNVGTEIVFSMLERAKWAESFCFMLQKEVVQRMLTQSPGTKSYGVLGIKLSYLAKVLGHFWVKAGSFSPPPKVESGVLWYKRKAPGDTEEYRSFKKTVDLAFLHRRKMIKKAIPEIPAEYATKRPDQLVPEVFLQVSKSIAKKG